MAYGLGIKTIKRLCQEQLPIQWQKAKLTPSLFKPYEQPMFTWVQDHLSHHHALPQIDTLHAQFPDTAVVDVPEPSSYYVKQLEAQFFYSTLNRANVDSQDILKNNQEAHEEAMVVLQQAVQTVIAQRHRVRILDVGKDAAQMVLHAYYQTSLIEQVGEFGWPYMDQQSGGVMPGDVISFVGRPAVGKTWLTLWTAMHNWMVKKMNVLYVSMEMMTLPVAQRITALYTHQNIAQLKMAGFSTISMKKFQQGLKGLQSEAAKMYVVDGNLATNVEELFALAQMLECRVVFIDGAYLLRHKNFKLDRFTRAAENVELIKRHCTDLEMMSFCSWQFNREASKKQKKGHGELADLEDIGYSDAIGQISSVVLSLYQEDGIETMKERKVQVLKGRNGEVGQFTILWNFITMNFAQLGTVEAPEPSDSNLEWV